MRQEQLTLAMLRDADGRVGKETLCARLDGYETGKIIVLRALGGHLGQFAGASCGHAGGILVELSLCHLSGEVVDNFQSLVSQGRDNRRTHRGSHAPRK